MRRKMLNSLCLPWAVLCAWTHLPLFSEPFQFCALLFIIIIMVVITLILLPIFFLLIFILVLFAACVYCALHCNCISKKGKKTISILISSALGPLACSASRPASALSLLCAAASAFNSRSPPLLSSYMNSQFLLLF